MPFGIVLVVLLFFGPPVAIGLAWAKWRRSTHSGRVRAVLVSAGLWTLLLAVILASPSLMLLQGGPGGKNEPPDDTPNPSIVSTEPPPIGSSPTTTPGTTPSTAPVPAFPWPPPAASAEFIVPALWLPDPGSTLEDVGQALERALRRARYRTWSYSSVPRGFALVTQLEQTAKDGGPSPEPARWSAALPQVSTLTLVEFLKALVGAQPGYYRVFAFLVTDQPWSRTGKAPIGSDAERWLAEGLTRLPPSLAALPYQTGYRTTVLIYEFRKIASDAPATLVAPAALRGEDHLAKAGIAEALTQP